ncbi:hypothetical protein D3C71_1698220 [compost metagenome]
MQPSGQQNGGHDRRHRACQHADPDFGSMLLEHFEVLMKRDCKGDGCRLKQIGEPFASRIVGCIGGPCHQQKSDDYQGSHDQRIQQHALAGEIDLFRREIHPESQS